ncbi:hypothetical protein CDD81_8044 [Ophiocordyceps australis]|uniref:2-(3-amino-3-carboxypropyl)histidine synthase subunit 2 n=1 Tax=Ophiocordyceps australis TaxID=1399860 RepID=A0A2C5X8T2_9HYPO|nr:hypothetical protein CDD81_8044 [Ophiocordyceps australis]
MPAQLTAAPVLSTPDDRIFEAAPPSAAAAPRLSDEQVNKTYEIERTVAQILQGRWTRIALQFPDEMLVDAPHVAQNMRRELLVSLDDAQEDKEPRIHILADTSYSACCVDEVAAEHVDAEVVVHYGRTCLSPTSRLPVIHVYTRHELDMEASLARITSAFPDKETKVVVMADLTFQEHVSDLVERLEALGYANVLGTEVVRDPTAVVPNRRIVGLEACQDDGFKEHVLLHLSEPPAALLLALYSRFASLQVLDTSCLSLQDPTLQTAALLRRRYARVLSLASAGVIGILVNTLSVSNYLSSIDTLRAHIARAGKKSYTVVVGKLNPAKLANLSEIEGWVSVGCWESGLVAEDASYWRPVVTPFELQVALMSERDRTWGAEWWGGTEKLQQLQEPTTLADEEEEQQTGGVDAKKKESGETALDDEVDEEESLAPEFDLRTGKLVSHSRPMRLPVRRAKANGQETWAKERGKEVAVRAAGEVMSINGVASPGAEYLRTKRTWQGLGSDFGQTEETSTIVEEGRSGTARGYVVGNGERH